MAIRCKLLGHTWGNWNFGAEKREVSEDIKEDGVKIGEDIYLIKTDKKTCKRCGRINSRTRKNKQEQRRIEYDISDSHLPPEAIKPTHELDDSERGGFFSDLRNFVKKEMDAERETRWRAYTDLGIQSAIRQEKVAGPFVPLTRGQSNKKPEYWFNLVQNNERESESVKSLRGDEGLFDNDICVMDCNRSESDFPIEVKLKKVKNTSLSLTLQKSTKENNDHIKQLLQEDGFKIYLYKIMTPIPYNRRLEAINTVESHRQKSQLLTGDRSVKFTNKYPAPEAPFELNDYQRKALVWADCSDDLVLIHGPPGTGKTRTLTAYIRHAVSKGESVLVAAHSNQAVDNLIAGDSTSDQTDSETLHAMAQDGDLDISIARVGNNSRNPVVNHYYGDTPEAIADVVAATTSGASKFDTNKFDVAVVDEATQASRPATAIVLNCAQKVVLAGDHKQLPPFSADEEMRDEEIHISLFEYLLEQYSENIAIFLRKQYRMNEKIARFPNRAFYDGQLETADQNRDWQIKGLKPLIGINITGEEKQQMENRSYYNNTEAEAVAKQVKLLILHDVDQTDIGVITAYSGQIAQIKQKIRDLQVCNTNDISIDTVDSFQGSEREAIIVSFVRSNEENNSGFLELPDQGERRLNVALTRARKRLVLIANWKTLGEFSPYRSENKSCAQLYAHLSEHIRSQDVMLEK